MRIKQLLLETEGRQQKAEFLQHQTVTPLQTNIDHTSRSNKHPATKTQVYEPRGQQQQQPPIITDQPENLMGPENMRYDVQAQ